MISAGTPSVGTRNTPTSGPSLIRIWRCSGADGPGGELCRSGRGATMMSGACDPNCAATAVASRTVASDSACDGSPLTKIVSWRNTGGRKSATTVGAISTPAKATAPSENRSGFVGSRQYPGTGSR